MQDIAAGIGDGADAAKVVRHEETVAATSHVKSRVSKVQKDIGFFINKPSNVLFYATGQ